MENSVFETFSDKQMIKYMRYALPLLNELDRRIEYFSDENDELSFDEEVPKELLDEDLDKLI